MTLIDAYPALRSAHLLAVGASVALFTLRALAVLAGARWPLTPVPRVASVVIDTALFTAGVSMWVALGLNPLRDHWLGVKLVLLVVYVVLGAWALRRAPTRRAKAGCLAAALAVFGFMVTVAVAHHPLGVAAALIRVSDAPWTDFPPGGGPA
ncbi:SirB2 family protein [Calidifontimicrobium sp. SYSU G02091]|uniref:SirB2 family protein n=1 Tax=Calidifontimicrobium sp. SYSU G02091 TaxID=2926421 RepID=UPI001F531943|nr:SirB2 family protein [Calidifontimicrobium sp. SYSU G02091]MCI1190948.1 SirB2 family protein [Calidifontimicrobium sp. SYSU G02091]